MALRNALADPDDVATLLLLQLEEGVEDSKVELLHESILVQPHLNHLVSDLGKTLPEAQRTQGIESIT